MLESLPFTLVVSGPVKSRFSSSLNSNSLRDSFILVKNMNASNQIIISTYKDEFPNNLNKYVDKVIINSDPGPDLYRVDPWPISNASKQQTSNISRMLKCTSAGLAEVQTEIVIKSRVELLPENSQYFQNWYVSNAHSLVESQKPLILFLIEHFSGISFSINGILGMVPDTFQVSKTDTLKRTWDQASLFWENYSLLISNSGRRFPLIPEQIIGLNFLNLYGGFDLHKEIPKLRRHFVSTKLVKSQIYAERELINWISYRNSGLSLNYFAKTAQIDSSRIYDLGSKVDIYRALLNLVAKKIYHHYRRYYIGFRQVFFSRQ